MLPRRFRRFSAIRVLHRSRGLASLEVEDGRQSVACLSKSSTAQPSLPTWRIPAAACYASLTPHMSRCLVSAGAATAYIQLNPAPRGPAPAPCASVAGAVRAAESGERGPLLSRIRGTRPTSRLAMTRAWAHSSAHTGRGGAGMYGGGERGGGGGGPFVYAQGQARERLAGCRVLDCWRQARKGRRRELSRARRRRDSQARPRPMRAAAAPRPAPAAAAPQRTGR